MSLPLLFSRVIYSVSIFSTYTTPEVAYSHQLSSQIAFLSINLQVDQALFINSFDFRPSSTIFFIHFIWLVLSILFVFNEN